MAEINDLSTTDASNTARFPEGQAPSTVNNGARALEGIIARFHRDLNASIVAGGTGNAITVAAAQTLTAYYDGLIIAFEAAAANTAAVTLNVDAVGAQAIRKNYNVALAANDIVAGQKVVCIYDADNAWWQMVSPVGNELVALAGAQTISGAKTFSATLAMSAAAINGAVRVDVASAATTNIGAAASNYVRITGTVTITAFDTVASGIWRHIVFGGALVLTHNATTLILPGNAANITTVAGDTALAISEGSGNWRVVDYVRASGASIVAPTTGAYSFVSTTTISAQATVDVQSLAAGYDYIFVLTGLITATDDVALFMRIEETGAFQSGAGAYSHETNQQAASASDTEIEFSAAAGGTAALSNAANEVGSFELRVPNVGATVRKVIYGIGVYTESGTANRLIEVTGGGAYIANTNAITGVRFLASSGNLTSGTLDVYRRQRS